MKYYTLQIAVLEKLTEAFRNIIKLSRNNPGLLFLAAFSQEHFFYTDQQNDK